MKRVTGKALRVIVDLVATTDSKADILRRWEVPESTFYTRWAKDPVFLARWEEERKAFEGDIRDMALVSRRRRLAERIRLYDATPDTAEEYWMEGQIKRIHSNASGKSSILNDIEREVEGRKIALTDPDGQPFGAALLDRRRKAADDLDVWEKDAEADGPD